MSAITKKKKKPKAQPYWCFNMEKSRMAPYKSMSQNDRTDAIGELWSKLGPEEKEVYKRMALHWNEKGKNEPSRETPSGSAPQSRGNQPNANNGRGLLNSRGQSIAEEIRLENEAKAYKQRMKNEVTKIIDDAATNGVFNRTIFHLISTSHFYSTSTDIWPAEIAMAKFCLLDGITDRFHTEIIPGKLPVSSAFDAKTKSESQHRYSLPRDDERDKSVYEDILEGMLKFFLPTEKIPILYTREAEVPYVSKVVKKIFSECNEGSSEVFDTIHVYSVDRLLCYLSAKCREIESIASEGQSISIYTIHSIPDAIKRFDSQVGAFEGCDFHTKEDATIHCSLAKVNGYGYLLAKFCCDPNQYEMIEGQHMEKTSKPINEDEDI